MAASPRRVSINIISDVICPWCFIGKRRLETALRTLEPSRAAAVEVRWRPFLLNASLPAAGVDKMAHYISKFGAARVSAMLPSMAAVGSAEGIAFDYGGLIASSVPAHTLLEAAWERGGAALQDALAEGLFRYFFEQRGNLGDADALAAAAEAAGLRGAAALLRDDDTGVRAAAVARDAEAWRARYRVSGVPTFVISDGQRVQALSGAQDAELLAEVIGKMLEAAA